MQESALASFLKSLGKHPKGFWFIFWGELAERCSYYGMRAILALYMVERLGFTQSESGVAMSVFIGACYFLPLIGGWVADNFLGKYWTIVGFSVPYIAGHLILGVENNVFLIAALGLLAMGTGVIKPNISTLMGLTYDQQRPGDKALRSDAFGIFYMAINIGAVLSQATMPSIRSSYGYAVAFAFPAALMVLAFIAFAAGKKHYAVEKVERNKVLSPEEASNKRLTVMLIAIVGTIFAAVTAASLTKSPYLVPIGVVGFIVFAGALAKVLGRLGAIFALVTFFWAIFDQSASTWIFFANKHFDLNVFGTKIEPDAIQAINPFLIVVLVPTFAIVWRVFAAKGRTVRASDKMMVGFILTALTMGVMAVAGFVAQGGTQVNILWQAGAYLLLTSAEVCISVVGLELAFTAAPLHMKSFVTACWLSCVAIANLCINAPITELYDSMPPGTYFSLLTGMMLPVIAIFGAISPSFNRELAAGEAKEAEREKQSGAGPSVSLAKGSA